jgi:alkaline phosphatase
MMLQGMKYALGSLLALLPVWLAHSAEGPQIRIVLPETMRLLERQRVDLVIEGRNLPEEGVLKVSAAGRDVAARLSRPRSIDLDCDGGRDFVWRVDLHEFVKPGLAEVRAEWTGGGARLADVRQVQVQPFAPSKPLKNVIIFIGDAMGGSYRDAARMVARVDGYKDGYYPSLLEMDQMPVSGHVMHNGAERIVSDSAATATHWSTGTKPYSGMLSVLPDGTDCHWRRGPNVSQLENYRDNPRVESLLEYLKRRFGYRTGNVSTAYLTDATPAAQGAHTPSRSTAFEIARQFLENPLLDGKPAFDVLLGGGKEDFDPDIRSDKRDLVAEFQKQGYRFVSTRTELNSVPAETGKLIGFFRRPNQVSTHASGLRATANGNMDVAYDKLKLTRPGSEPQPNFGAWTDQPFLDEMTRKAIEILSAGGKPFALQVEGAHIDKQSHSNHFAGVVWDAIELDKAVGVARQWARARNDTLIVVSGDHDQTMVIVGAVEISDADLYDRTPIAEQQGAKVFKDSAANHRGNLGTLPAEVQKFARPAGVPDYFDADGDGYPENRESGGRGRKRLAVGFRSDDHAGMSLPITAEGPGALLFTGYMDQTDVFFRLAASLGDTRRLDTALADLIRVRPPVPLAKRDVRTGSSN